MGEDGPTHQPVEQLLSLRAIPNMTVIRPADANETTAAWQVALTRSGPTSLVFSRQKLPILDPEAYPVAVGVPRGGYVLAEASSGTPSLILIATGSEVPLALDARRELEKGGVATRVVSLPSWELFDEQTAAYRAEVLPDRVPKVSVEAGVSLGWSKYVGTHGASIGVDRFGASAPGPVVQREFGFTVDHIVEVARSVLAAPNGGGRA
jgi:transketolase